MTKNKSMKIERLITKYHERPTAFNGFWMFIAEITGVMENHCRKHHRQYQTIRQVQYDGASIIECSYCPRHFWRK